MKKPKSGMTIVMGAAGVKSDIVGCGATVTRPFVVCDDIEWENVNIIDPVSTGKSWLTEEECNEISNNSTSLNGKL